MPDGSSSAAPVVSPGPRDFQYSLAWPICFCLEKVWLICFEASIVLSKTAAGAPATFSRNLSEDILVRVEHFILVRQILALDMPKSSAQERAREPQRKLL